MCSFFLELFNIFFFTRYQFSPLICLLLGLRDRLKNGGNIVVAEGYLLELERRGYLQAGAFIPEVVLEHPEVVKALHDEFVHAGSDVVVAFTVSEYNEFFIYLLVYLPHYMYLIQNFIDRLEDLHARIKHVTEFNKIVIPYYFKAYSRQWLAAVL